MKRYTIILNPIAGKGHAILRKAEIEAFFNENKMDYEIVLTERPGHGIILAEHYGSIEENIVIAAGGDGTCNEVINGLMQAAAKNPAIKPVLGVLAIGRGNDFSFGAKVPSLLHENLLHIRDAETAPMDVGEVKGGNYPDGRYFGNGVGIGFDAIVGFEAARMHRIHGAFAYTVGALKTMIKYPASPNVEITYDDEKINIQAALISIMNGRRMGGPSLWLRMALWMTDSLIFV